MNIKRRRNIFLAIAFGVIVITIVYTHNLIIGFNASPLLTTEGTIK